MMLFVVGRASPAYIKGHKRLSAYDKQAFRRLEDILSAASALVVTPNILSETSNLLGQRDDESGRRIMSTFRSIIEIAVERYASGRAAANRPEFIWLGLPDAAAIDALEDHTILITDDGPRYAAALKAGRHAELFSSERLAAG
jgi:hypothetical protein